MCAYRATLGSIGRYKLPTIVDLIIFPLGDFTLIVFVVGIYFFRWADNVIKFPVHTESATAELSSFDSGLFFVVGALEILLHICVLSIPF